MLDMARPKKKIELKFWFIESDRLLTAGDDIAAELNTERDSCF